MESFETNNNQEASAESKGEQNSKKPESILSAPLIIGFSFVVGCLILAIAYVYVKTDKENVNQISISEEDQTLSDIEQYEDDSAFSLSEKIGSPKAGVNDSSSVPNGFPTLILDEADYTKYYQDILQQPGVVWFQHPVFKGVKDFFSYKEEVGMSTDRLQLYYQIGTYFDKEILITYADCFDMLCDYDPLIFVGLPETGYELIANHSSNFEGEWTSSILRSDIGIDRSLSFRALSLPKDYVVEGIQITPRSSTEGGSAPNGFYASSFKNPEESYYKKIEFVTDTPYGPLLRTYGEESSFSSDIGYVIRLPGGLTKDVSLPIPEFIRDDGVPNIAWLSGGFNTDRYRVDGLGGCGWGGPEIANDTIPDSDLALVGQTGTNEPIYALTNIANPFVQRVFEATGGKYYDYDTVNEDTVVHTYTPEEFVSVLHGVLVYKDRFGLQHILTNSKYGPQAECAKPVIYLYPEVETEVSVAVDALVTKSDPEYKDGWKVIASPDGSLALGDTQYTSLFWDGYGNGPYPEINEGFIVKTEDSLGIMKDHLTFMGFNDTEIKEFIEFWEPHLPTTPFIRFSWLGTGAMESLAKLTIEPKPDTLIRAFIDFEGLEELDEIKEQRLYHNDRVGFTVVEWGGLLRK